MGLDHGATGPVIEGRLQQPPNLHPLCSATGKKGVQTASFEVPGVASGVAAHGAEIDHLICQGYADPRRLAGD
jgi:hypothetical protein